MRLGARWTSCPASFWRAAARPQLAKASKLRTESADVHARLVLEVKRVEVIEQAFKRLVSSLTDWRDRRSASAKDPRKLPHFRITDMDADGQWQDGGTAQDCLCVGLPDGLTILFASCGSLFRGGVSPKISHLFQWDLFLILFR